MLMLLAGIALLVIYSGAYNIAATEGHSGIGRWVLETTMRNSVVVRAGDIEAPAGFTPAAVVTGGSEYKAMCEHCHGGPNVERAGWARGIVPVPPRLSQAAREWRPNEIFWIVKHGIKMSAMPAFGETHDDEILWNITAFVEALPGMTGEQYAAIPTGHGGSEGAADSGHSGHSH